MTVTSTKSLPAAAQRITTLDVLRGVALLGILPMNIQSFSMPDAAYLNPTAYGDLTGANLWVWIVIQLLANEKMYGLLSMLFGAGIVLMSDSLERRGTKAGPIHYRRMGWLMLFGLLHGHLLWFGDILWCYGVCGLVAYLFRKRSPRTLLVSAAVFFTLGSLIYMGFGWLIVHSSPQDLQAFVEEDWQPTPAMIQQEIVTFRGGWLSQMQVRSSNALLFETLVMLILYGWKTIGNMLLGMALLKWRIITGEQSRARYVRMTIAGFAIGLTLVAVGIGKDFSAGWDARYSFFFGSQYNYWAAVLVDFGWIGLIVLATSAARLGRFTERLAAIGRTAFSNYILQTIVCSMIFYGNGLAWFGAVSRVEQALIVLAIWLVQLTISPLWLRRFAFGPLEWLWRSLTYWRWMPLTIRSAEIT